MLITDSCPYYCNLSSISNQKGEELRSITNHTRHNTKGEVFKEVIGRAFCNIGFYPDLGKTKLVIHKHLYF